MFPFVVGWEGGVGGGRYTDGVSTTLGVSHVETKSRWERDDRVSQNPVVCLIFPFIARREGVAVPVAGWQVYHEQQVNMYNWKGGSKQDKRRSLDTDSINKVLMQMLSSQFPSMPGCWVPNDASKRPAQS